MAAHVVDHGSGMFSLVSLVMTHLAKQTVTAASCGPATSGRGAGRIPARCAFVVIVVVVQASLERTGVCPAMRTLLHLWT